MLPTTRQTAANFDILLVMCVLPTPLTKAKRTRAPRGTSTIAAALPPHPPACGRRQGAGKQSDACYGSGFRQLFAVWPATILPLASRDFRRTFPGPKADACEPKTDSCSPSPCRKADQNNRIRGRCTKLIQWRYFWL